jgi:hypothetical protein
VGGEEELAPEDALGCEALRKADGEEDGDDARGDDLGQVLLDLGVRLLRVDDVDAGHSALVNLLEVLVDVLVRALRGGQVRR